MQWTESIELNPINSFNKLKISLKKDLKLGLRNIIQLRERRLKFLRLVNTLTGGTNGCHLYVERLKTSYAEENTKDSKRGLE